MPNMPNMQANMPNMQANMPNMQANIGNCNSDAATRGSSSGQYETPRHSSKVTRHPNTNSDTKLFYPNQTP